MPIEWLRHAFAVEQPGPAEPTADQRAVIERLCAEVVRRRMTTPALAFLELSRPLNYFGAQALHFFDPMVSAVTDADGHRQLATFLEQRGAMDYLSRRIEELESEAESRERGATTPPATELQVADGSLTMQEHEQQG